MKLNYFNFIENIPLGIILISRDKLILAINSITKKNLEIKSEDYIGKSIYNLQLFLFNKDKIEKLFNKMQYETSYPLTLKSSNHNDYKFRYECKINLLVINNEKIFQILFLDKDNQENNKLAQIFASDQEQISNKSLNQQFLFLENSNDFITVIDDHFKIEYINEKYHKEVMGFTKEDILGRAALSFVYPEDVQKISKLMRKSFRKGVGRAEVRCVDKNGKVIWVEIKGKTFIGRDGKKKALLISRDITKRLEILEKLKESEQKFRTIAQQSFMGIGIIQDNNFKYVNEKFAEITGYDLNVILRWEYNEFIKLIYEKDR
ncbi:MAG: PAS domain S-box protein, partial [Candidatus Lokiarchaeota archaeon]